MNSLSNNSKATFKYFGDELDNLEAIWLTLLARDRSGSNSALSGQMKFQVREGILSKRSWTRRHVNRKIYAFILCSPHRLRHRQVFSKNPQGVGGQWSTQPCVQSGTPLCLWSSSSSFWILSWTSCTLPHMKKVRQLMKLRKKGGWRSHWSPSLPCTSGLTVTLAVTGSILPLCGVYLYLHRIYFFPCSNVLVSGTEPKRFAQLCNELPNWECKL